jgi:hypothetical protein
MHTRRFWPAPLALVLSFSLCGSWVFEELAVGGKEMERYSNTGAKKRQTAPSASSATSQEAEGEGFLDTTKWSQSASSLTPWEARSDLVRRQTGGSVGFTREADCLAGGGRVLD